MKLIWGGPAAGVCKPRWTTLAILVTTVQWAICLLLVAGAGVSCTTPRAHQAACPYDLQEILGQSGLTNIVPIQALCWKQQQDDRPLVVDKVVLLGSRGTNIVLVSAYRHPVGGSGRWHRTEISAIFDRGEMWIIGEREFPRMPTGQDVEEFKADTWWDEGAERFRTVFKGQAVITHPK